MCRRCWRAIGPPGSAPLAAVGSVSWATPYDGVARAALTALKFGARTALADPLGALTATACRDLAAGRTVVAVPPGKGRLRTRGFDPAAMIAAEVARSLDVPRTACLHRCDTRRQVGRPRSERLTDGPRIEVRGRIPSSVLLIDDVLTTGATLVACAKALASAGCASIAAATFARSFGETRRPA